MNPGAVTIALSLISHTNAGKTTLARTLLGRDVGEVRDAPHVTTEAASFALIQSERGDVLMLWDTPGFGDSARLARRLAQEGNPIGWFLSEVWDRFRDRAFWLTQLAVRNVRDNADVILYMVNASEEPADAGYLAPELDVLARLHKPVLVLLNQMGPPRAAADEADDVARWRDALRRHACVRDVLALDAFARCWVQEFALFAAIEPLLPEPRRQAFARLDRAWRARRWAQFDTAMSIWARVVANAVCARVSLPPQAMLQRLGHALGVGTDTHAADAGRAPKVLLEAVEADLRQAMAQLIAIHDLEGSAAGEVEARMASDVLSEGPVGEGKAAAMGGIVSGAAAGLAADLAAGGLTFGAGMLTGAVIGALGGAGAARVYNVVRGKTEHLVRWGDAFLERLVVEALLRYLAVAHYGRGRGDYHDAECPPHWRGLVEAAVAARRAPLAAIFAERGPRCDGPRVAEALQPLLAQTTRAVLEELYPGAFEAGAGVPQ